MTAIGTTAVILLAVVLYLRSENFRQRWHSRRVRDTRRRRRECRELMLEEAGVRQCDLQELSDTVEHVVANAPRDAHHAKLEDLLDAYARLALARDAYAIQVRRAPVAISDSTPPHQRAIRGREISWRQTCGERLALSEERMAEISQLIGLYAQRALAPEIDYLFDDDVVARGVAMFDEASGPREAETRAS